MAYNKKEYDKAWGIKNALRIKTRRRAYYLKNKDRMNQQSRAYYSKNKQKCLLQNRVRRLKNPDYETKRKYGISFKDFDDISQKQDGKCLICQKSSHLSGRYGKLQIDHCHKTGGIRGLLCSSCNRGLGFFKDDVTIVKRAVKYLKGEFKCQRKR